MFIVWMVLLMTYWDAFGYRTVVKIILRHHVPHKLSRASRDLPRPTQEASSYG